MAITGYIRSLFADKEKTSPLFPITKTQAVINDDGKNLDDLLIYSSDEDIEAAVDVRDADTLGGKTENMLSVANANTLGGKAPEYYVQPRNLLDNSDFAKPVNQRGASSYTINSYTIDRWRSSNLNAEIGLGENCLRVKSTTGKALYFFQPIEYSKIKSEVCYTFAVGMKGGAKYVVSGLIGIGITTSEKSYTHDAKEFTLAVINQETYFQTTFATADTEGFEIEWMALYEGEYTAETLPPYVPKGYGVESMECCRYYIRLDWFHMGLAASTTSVKLMIPVPVTMRVKPTIVGSINWVRQEGKQYNQSNSSLTVDSMVSNAVYVTASDLTGLTNTYPCAISLSGGALSADI